MRSKKIVATVGAAATVFSGLLSGAVLHGGVAAADPGCPKMYVVAVPGTWETSDQKGRRPTPGMLAGATRGLPSGIKADYVTYAATAFPWEGAVYGASRKEATDNARGMIGAMAQRCGATKFGIIGYSQGADAAGDLAAEIGSGHGVVPPNRVVAVGLVSDPQRSPTDAIVGPAVGGTGAEGPRPGGFGFVSPVTRTFCARGDLYCAASKDDLLVRAGGVLAGLSSGNVAQMANMIPLLGPLLGDLFNSGGIMDDASNERRALQVQRFYNSGIHNEYGYYRVDGRSTATQWLRQYLINQAG